MVHHFEMHNKSSKVFRLGLDDVQFSFNHEISGQVLKMISTKNLVVASKRATTSAS